MIKEEQWIVGVTKWVIGTEGMAELLTLRESLTPAQVNEKFRTSHIDPKVKKLTPQELGSVCAMGSASDRPNLQFNDFFQVSNFGDLDVKVASSMSGIQMLWEIAAAVICCIACDIVKQDLYKAEEGRRDKVYALK